MPLQKLQNRIKKIIIITVKIAYLAKMIVAAQMSDNGSRIALFVAQQAQVRRLFIGVVLLNFQQVFEPQQSTGVIIV